MFSSRFSGISHGANPLWEAVEARRSSGAEILDLTSSNPTAAGIPYPSVIASLLARPSVLEYRPSPRGSLEARRAIGAYLGGMGRSEGDGQAINPEDLLLTSSTSEAYAFLFKLLCDPGDEVLIPVPTYPLFDSLADLDHVNLVRYPLRLRDSEPEDARAAPPSRWLPDLNFLRNLISTRTKALILVSPNNPTGHIAGPGEIAAYLEMARDYGLALIVDEVFSEYVLGEDHAHPLLPRKEGPLVFTLNGLSKLAGLPQLKLAWIHVGGDAALARQALEHLEWIADAYLSVNTPAQAACAEILALAPEIRTAIQGRLRANLAAAGELLVPRRKKGPGPEFPAGMAGRGSALRVKLLRPEAGWSLVMEVQSEVAGGNRPQEGEDFALDLLRQRGVYVHPGHLFGFEEGEGRFHLVLSLLTPEAIFRRGFRLLLDQAGGYGNA